MGLRQPKITDRDYWPAILERLTSYAAQNIAPTTAARMIGKEFGCETVTIYHTMQRGDVPSYPSTDRARAEAWQEGRVRYIRGLHCQKCEERVFSAGDGRCVNCDNAWVRKSQKEKRDQLAEPNQTHEFHSGRGLFAPDKILFEAEDEQEPFTRGSKLHAMANAMLDGATLDELAMITKWTPENITSMFYQYLVPKGYGVGRRDGRYYLRLKNDAATISFY